MSYIHFYLDGKPWQTMASIKDVARLAGVSVATVSRAIAIPEKVSEKTLKKVNDAVALSGYRPNLLARNFRSSRSFCIVVMVPDITNPFFSQVIKAIEDRAQQRGYAVLLGDTRDQNSREQEYVHRVETRLADGLIQLRPNEIHVDGDPLPIVYACGCENVPNCSVTIDNTLAAKKVVDYLVSLGHTRIGCLTGLRENPHSMERLAGYRQALEAAGLEYSEQYVSEGDFTLGSGQDAAKKIMCQAKPPTALFCMSDQMAMGAIQALQAQGVQIPQQVSIVGFDNIAYAEFWHPTITTVSQPAEEMGKRAVDMLVSIIEGKEFTHESKILPTQLIVRDSSGAAPKDPA
ncbi:LacI family DNA-binding transcriptional regulator [Marinagarivorans cellulosilyticus]|nr:LacI family DNA-binding transcriptional regulator [Marinagarivorans cellulosilyticus]